MRTTTLPTQNMIVAYWLNSELTNTFACPPLRNVLAFTRQDGTPLVNVVNLVGASFCRSRDNFQPPYVSFAPSLLNMLRSGDITRVHQAGVKVVLTIMGASDCVQWSSVPQDKAEALATWLNREVLQKYSLDGIDVDDEYGVSGSNEQLVAVMKAMDNVFLPDTIISKALFNESANLIKSIKDYLTYGGIMYYGNDASYLEGRANWYQQAGLAWDQILIGVNAGPISQPQGNFTSIATTQALTAWQPQGGTKRGMMLWSFSQDIQQFTADPQYDAPYMSSNDHAWLQAIAQTMWNQWVVHPDRLMGPYIPGGSYFWTSRNIKVILSATCTTKSGGTNRSTLDITNGTTFDIMNDDGVLRQTNNALDAKTIKAYMENKAQRGLGVYVPNGSFLLSSADIKLVLSAKCTKIDQTEVDSSLDVTALGWDAWVENIDGVLTIARLAAI